MICIYVIYWDYTKVYVGQTQNYNKRKSQHISDLKAHRHKNWKLQHEYNTCGMPIIEVLEQTQLDNLNTLETFWINEFDSINNGFNISEGGDLKDKVNTPGSVYSKIVLLRAFRLLYTTTLSYRKIANLLHIDKNVPYRIRTGNHYLWIRDRYPKLFSKMISKRSEAVHP